MVLCDHVHQDSTSGKFTLLGTFNQINAAAFPVFLPFAVYFAITDGQGEFEVRLRLVDSQVVSELASKPILDAPARLTLSSPSSNPVAVVGVEIPRPGVPLRIDLQADPDVASWCRVSNPLETGNAAI
jgi:hypothetical protein